MTLETAVAVATIASPIVAAMVGAAQVAVVAWGIWVMTRAQDAREDARAAREDARAAREDARHRESMEALRALIHGMETVIARTAPKGDSQ